jgi:hypothetical protein
MKLTSLSTVLFLATSAVAYPNGVRPDGHNRRTQGVPGENRALKGGKTKGSKGMGGVGMKDKGANGCQSLKIKVPYDEVEPTETAVGETLAFPVYDFYTDEQIGTYTGHNTNIFVGDEIADCTFTASFNFDFDASLEFPFVSQVMIAGTCSGATNSITGGTGKYACASGSEFFIDTGEFAFGSDLFICNTCA